MSDGSGDIVALQPLVIVLAGPNGAGKSTAAAHLLPAGIIFVNADETARTLPGYPSKAVDIQAGRLVLEQMAKLERARSDFAIETTLASRSLATRITRLRGSGYFFRLIFIWAPSPEYSISRVAFRVRMGGHAIPEETIRRRYEAGLKNFFHLYQPLTDAWEIHENTQFEGFRIIAERDPSGSTIVHNPEVWERVREGGGDV